MKKHTFVLLVLFSTLQAWSQVPARKVLFIGIDGCRWDAVQTANATNIDGLLATSVYSGDGLNAYPTWSGNGWSSMLTGTWHTKHGVTDNTFAGSNFLQYPDFITRAETYDTSLRTISCVHWAPLNTLLLNVADQKLTFATDLDVKNAAVNALGNDNPNILFVAFDDVDHAGHSYGFQPAIPEYIDAIEITDSYVGEILTALYARPNYSNEEWLVILTTDHGGNIAGHGGGSLEERTIFTIYQNNNIQPSQLNRIDNVTTVTANEGEIIAGSFAQPIDQLPFDFGATQDFTVELWVKANAAFTGDPAFISNKDWNNGYNPGFVICGQADEYWKVNIGDGTNRVDIQGGEIESGVWHHLAITCDRDGLMTVYEDGVVVGFTNMSNIGNINSGLPLTINQDGTTTYGYDFDGSYKYIRIWNTVLPQTEIINWAATNSLQLHPYYGNLLASWNVEDSSGLVLQDESINNNSCNVTGSVLWITGQTSTLITYDHANTAREPDNAVTALDWLCIPIDPNWNLDGVSRIAYPCTSTFVGDVNQIAEFTLLPNPATHQFEVRFRKPLNNAKITIYNSQGKIIWEKKELSGMQQSVQLNLEMKAGIYMVKLEAGEILAIKKIIVQSTD